MWGGESVETPLAPGERQTGASHHRRRHHRRVPGGAYRGYVRDHILQGYLHRSHRAVAALRQGEAEVVLQLPVVASQRGEVARLRQEFSAVHSFMFYSLNFLTDAQLKYMNTRGV